jgi:methionine sulfoxide reductase heme-binding subunit
VTPRASVVLDPGTPSASPGPIRRGIVYRGLPRPLRVALWITYLVVVGIVIGWTFPPAMRLAGSAAALAPGKVAWYGARATGFLAYVAVAGSVVYGLMLSTKLLDAIAHRPVSFALHKDLALVGIALSGLHGLVLLGDQTYAYTPAAIVIPFASPYAPAAVGVGQLAFYGLAIVIGSFHVRRRIGQRAWRRIHYLTFAGFVGVTAHGIASGSDTGAGWTFWVYLGPSAVVVFFVVYRVVSSTAERRDSARRARGQAAAVAGLGRFRSPPTGRMFRLEPPSLEVVTGEEQPAVANLGRTGR